MRSYLTMSTVTCRHPSIDSETGERRFGSFESGLWWERTLKHINRDFHGKIVYKVFPIILYVDETFLTREGTFKAKPLFAQTGM